jgi:hypothetical protein
MIGDLFWGNTKGKAVKNRRGRAAVTGLPQQVGNVCRFATASHV